MSGLGLEQHGLEPLHHASGLLRVRARADAEHVVGGGDAQFLEEDLGHRRVVVLAGVDQHRVELVGTSLELGDDRRRLHEVGASADNREHGPGGRHRAHVRHTRCRLRQLGAGLRTARVRAS